MAVVLMTAMRGAKRVDRNNRQAGERGMGTDSKRIGPPWFD